MKESPTNEICMLLLNSFPLLVLHSRGAIRRRCLHAHTLPGQKKSSKCKAEKSMAVAPFEISSQRAERKKGLTEPWKTGRS